MRHEPEASSDETRHLRQSDALQMRWAEPSTIAALSKLRGPSLSEPSGSGAIRY